MEIAGILVYIPLPHLFILLLDGLLVYFLQVVQKGVRKLFIALVQQGAKVNSTPNIRQLKTNSKFVISRQSYTVHKGHFGACDFVARLSFTQRSNKTVQILKGGGPFLQKVLVRSEVFLMI